MEHSQVQELQHLWDGSDDNWVLIRLGDGENDYSIFNRKDHSALVIEDDSLYFEVIKRMKAAGRPILDELPP